MGFIELVALQPLFLQQLDLQLQASVYFRQLGCFYGIALLQLDGVGLKAFELVSSFGELPGELIVVLGQMAVLLDQAVHFQLELLSFTELDLQQRYLIEQSPVFRFRAEGVFEVDFFFDEVSFEARGRAPGVVRRGVPIVAHLTVKLII